MIRGLLALAVIVAAVLPGAAPAAAATLPKDIAAQLRRSPLVVDPSLAEAVPAAQRRAVLRAIEAAPYPVWVVLVPLTPGDRYGGDASRFLRVIHGRLGRDGVYLTADDRLLTYMAFGVDEEQPDLYQASTVGNFESRDFDEPQIAKVRRFLEALARRIWPPASSARRIACAAQREEFDSRAAAAPPATTATPAPIPAAAGCCPSGCWRRSAPAARSCTGAGVATRGPRPTTSR